ncbi:MAG: hypothetical protein WAO00_15905 [Chthoniobacterales bacterium]
MRTLVPIFLLAFTFLSALRSQADMQDLVRESKFIFQGTVRKLEAVTLASAHPSKETAIVSVDEILRGPETLRAFKGKEITVLLKKGESFEAGQKWIFFTVGWLYGESLGVREIGRAPTTRALADMSRQIQTAVQKNSEQDLQKRVASAPLVVTGKVAATKPAPPEMRAGPASEHSPDWWQAEIEVESIEKGNLSEKTVTVFYPNSTDEFWYSAPKFRLGEKGLWILHTQQKPPSFLKAEIEGFTALDPEDFCPKEDADRIREVIKALR